MYFKLGLLPRVIIAIVLGILAGFIFPDYIIRLFSTFNSLFGHFLAFFIPFLILGLITAGIANLGANCGKLLVLTICIAYALTLFSGFFTWIVCKSCYPYLLQNSSLTAMGDNIQSYAPYFTIVLNPFLDVLSVLALAFLLGIGIASSQATVLKAAVNEFEIIIQKTIQNVIIPILPLFIFGLFLEMAAKDQMRLVFIVFVKLILLIFLITIIVLGLQYLIAGLFAKRNPIKMLRTMLPAYVTALGTQSSAATIPITLEQTIKNGVNPSLARFVIPLCATIHLSGSTMKIVACSLAIIFIRELPVSALTYFQFIFLLGLTMIAAPGVPGGAIMAALGIIQSVLGFDAVDQGLMISLYIVMDCFGTACNVTGDGAIAVIIDRIALNKTFGMNDSMRKSQRDQTSK